MAGADITASVNILNKRNLKEKFWSRIQSGDHQINSPFLSKGF
jgi:hypothetical protein